MTIANQEAVGFKEMQPMQLFNYRCNTTNILKLDDFGSRNTAFKSTLVMFPCRRTFLGVTRTLSANFVHLCAVTSFVNFN